MTVKAGEVIFKLIEAGANLELFGLQNELLAYAIHHRDKEVLSILLEKRVDLSGAIFYAVKSLSENGDLNGMEILSKLLEAGGNTRKSTHFDRAFDDEEEEDGYAYEYESEAMIVASRRGHAAIVSLLVSHGASADMEDEGGDFPLLIAARLGHEETVEVLLHNAPQMVEMTDIHGQSALDAVVDMGHFEVAMRLLQQGSQVLASWETFLEGCRGGRNRISGSNSTREIRERRPRQWGRFNTSNTVLMGCPGGA